MYNKNWDFTWDENDLKTLEIKEEKKIIKSNNNIDNNYNINLFFSENGRRRITINCNVNDLVSFAIQKYISKSCISDYRSLYIYHSKQIDILATLLRKMELMIDQK